MLKPSELADASASRVQKAGSIESEIPEGETLCLN
jgi:hypothetical protein